ncbi:MAG: Neelaredoxin, partial [Chloroflexi bacterium]|nr:Neelaredoxin [Chloroflexota bacterium]
MLSGQIQHADWKTEKHVPVIECPDTVKAGEFFEVTVSIGKEVAHPNTTEHHIAWITLYYQPEGDKF